ncbi:MAG: hypothetical protein GEV07_02280 [Streptosporangiales bacterium]|nr:hypothetical protein [Streptosporangiales bacterium]
MVESERAGVSALAAEIDRVARRLRGLSQARLRQPLPPYGTVADAGHRLAQLLADAALGVEHRADAHPASRPVPRLRDTAVADQVAVTGHDLLAALADLPADTQVWHEERQLPAADLVAATHATTRAIKLAID